jgi:hypothetical protein
VIKSMSTMASLSTSAKLKRLFVEEGTSSRAIRQKELSTLRPPLSEEGREVEFVSSVPGGSSSYGLELYSFSRLMKIS